jgi:hypothetical protein
MTIKRLNMRVLQSLVFAVMLLGGTTVDAQNAAVHLLPAPDKEICKDIDCSHRDALVFVHGIYGSRETFRNPVTNFDWPAGFPRIVAGRTVDTYILDYETRLVSWAKGTQPDFSEIDDAVFNALKQLRKSNYRSIGFVAHSLGGNIATSYIHGVKSRFGHAERSQHAFVITLGTPVLGADVANLASTLKAKLGMSDPLLESLKKDSLF